MARPRKRPKCQAVNAGLLAGEEANALARIAGRWSLVTGNVRDVRSRAQSGQAGIHVQTGGARLVLWTILDCDHIAVSCRHA